MALYSKVRNSPIVLSQDKDDMVEYTLFFRPQTWTASTELIQDDLLVIPTTSNGCMYEVAQGGITGATEPTTWFTGNNSITISGSVKFRALPYALLLNTGDIISPNISGGFPAFTFVTPTGLTIDSTALINSDSAIKFRVTSSPGLGTYTVTCTICVLRADSNYTKHDVSIVFNFIDN